MNKNKLTSLAHKISDKTKTPFNSVLTLFFLESILKRISSSKYKDFFVFKGGFLLASMFGISNRTTKDIDMLLINQNFDEKTILKIIKEIISTDIKDNIKYNIEKLRK